MKEHEKIFYSIEAGLSVANNVIQSFAQLYNQGRDIRPPSKFEKDGLKKLVSEEKKFSDLDRDLIVHTALKILNPWAKGINDVFKKA